MTRHSLEMQKEYIYIYIFCAILFSFLHQKSGKAKAPKMQDEKGSGLRSKLNMTVTAKLFCLQILTALLFVLYPPL